MSIPIAIGRTWKLDEENNQDFMLRLELVKGRHPHACATAVTDSDDGRRVALEVYKLINGQVRQAWLSNNGPLAVKVANTLHDWLDGRLADLSKYVWHPSRARVMGLGSNGPSEAEGSSRDARASAPGLRAQNPRKRPLKEPPVPRTAGQSPFEPRPAHQKRFSLGPGASAPGPETQSLPPVAVEVPRQLASELDPRAIIGPGLGYGRPQPGPAFPRPCRSTRKEELASIKDLPWSRGFHLEHLSTAHREELQRGVVVCYERWCVG